MRFNAIGRGFPSRVIVLAWVLTAGQGTGVSAQVPGASPQVLFEETAIAVSGATAGGEVVVYGVSRSWNGRSTRIREMAELLVDDDGDGAVRLDLAEEVPLLSLWLAMDLTSGTWTLVSPEGFVPQRQLLPPTALQPGTGNRVDRLVLDGRAFAALLVRPALLGAGGGWHLLIGDGGVDDGEAAEGALGFLLSQMHSIGTSPQPPAELAAGDLVVAIDLDTLDHLVTLLAAPVAAGTSGGR